MTTFCQCRLAENNCIVPPLASTACLRVAMSLTITTTTEQFLIIRRDCDNVGQSTISHYPARRFVVSKAGIPRRRHGHGRRHRLAKHGYSLTSDTREDPREEIARIGRKDVQTCRASRSRCPCPCRRRGMPA